MTPSGAKQTKSGSRLERILNSGAFAVTAELGPPKGTDVAAVRAKMELLRGVCDAVNITDNQTAIVRLSSVAASALLCQEGLEPVMQMTCRDRNRLAIQADVFGAVALGVRNLLLPHGRSRSALATTRRPERVRPRLDQLIRMIRRLRDEAGHRGERCGRGEVPIFIVAPPPLWRPL